MTGATAKQRRHRAWTAATVAIAACAVPLAFEAVGTAAGPTAAQALREANAWRSEAGIPPIRAMRRSWNEGCRKHNRYMSLNPSDRTPHSQERGRPGYSRAGDMAARTSVLASIEDGPRLWEHAVYHRASVLQPRLRVSGFASSHGRSCMRVFGGIERSAATRELTLYPWPAPGGRRVPLIFKGDESPSPYDESGASRRLGFLLSVGVNGPWRGWRESDVEAAVLTAAHGASIPVFVSDRDTPHGGNLDGGFGLFPLRPLLPATTYTARAVGKVVADGVKHPFDYTWSFTTARSGDKRAGELFDFVDWGLRRDGKFVYLFAYDTALGGNRLVLQPHWYRCRGRTCARRSDLGPTEKQVRLRRRGGRRIVTQRVVVKPPRRANAFSLVAETFHPDDPRRPTAREVVPL